MSGEARHRPGRSGRLRRQVRALLVAWVLLLALMLASLGIAYLPVGAGTKAAAGLAIAGVKALVVAIVFMQLGRGHALVRVVAGTGLAALLVLGALSAVDYATRVVEPAPLQLPQQQPWAVPGRR